MTKMECLHLICLTLFLICITGTYGDSMEIESFSQSQAKTSCKNGLIENSDEFTLKARITADIKQFEDRKIIGVNVYPKPPYHTRNFCYMVFSAACANKDLFGRCYCIGYINGAFEFSINGKAQLWMSEAAVSMLWTDNKNFHEVSKNVTLPVIYPQEETSLFVDNNQVDLGDCNVDFGSSDLIDWCVYNLHDLTVTVSFDYGVTTSDSNCVMHFFRYEQAKLKSFYVSFEEKIGCKRRKAFICQWRASGRKEKSINGGSTWFLMLNGWAMIITLFLQSMAGKLCLTVD